jgi:hypothetical protein
LHADVPSGEDVHAEITTFADLHAALSGDGGDLAGRPGVVGS